MLAGGGLLSAIAAPRLPTRFMRTALLLSSIRHEPES